MYRIGTRELKQHTGEIMARVQQGERVIVTYRGNPIAVISPIDQDTLEAMLAKEGERAEASSLGWLKASETAFGFWNNKEDEVWDQVQVKE
jgi:prevent-host-death family protein